MVTGLWNRRPPRVESGIGTPGPLSEAEIAYGKGLADGTGASEHSADKLTIDAEELLAHIKLRKGFSSGDRHGDQYVAWALEGLERWIEGKMQGPGSRPGSEPVPVDLESHQGIS